MLGITKTSSTSWIMNERCTGMEAHDDHSPQSQELDEESYEPPVTSSPAPSADDASDVSHDDKESTKATCGIL